MTRPPAFPGLLTADTRMAGTLLRWQRTGYLYAARRHKSPWQARAFAWYCAIAWWPLWPLLYALTWTLLTRRNTRYYLSDDHTAILAITAKRDASWNLEDHLSCHPGAGHGERLRARLAPTLLTVCDDAGIALTGTTAVPELAALYHLALPGLRDVGKAFPRGRKLRRDPQSLPAGTNPPKAGGEPDIEYVEDDGGTCDYCSDPLDRGTCAVRTDGRRLHQDCFSSE